MNVITVSRQMGSQGYEVASLVAKRLGFRLVERELINQAAKMAGGPEVALATVDELGLLNLCPSPKVCRAYCHAVEQVVSRLAAEGNVVIVGRAGNIILRDHPGVLHLRVIAPLKLRTLRVAQREGTSIKAARARVNASDAFRSEYLRRFYRCNWDDAASFDLTINTGRLTLDQSADLVCSVMKRPALV